jgi:hypothetical protein
MSFGHFLIAGEWILTKKKHLHVIFVLTILEMENSLFARTTSFSQSQEAALS